MTSLLDHPRCVRVELTRAPRAHGLDAIQVAARLADGSAVILHARSARGLARTLTRLEEILNEAALPKGSGPIVVDLERARKRGALRLADPVGWEIGVRDAMARAEGRIADAARALGVSWRTLHRWLAAPELADVPRHPAGVPYGPRRRALATTPAPDAGDAS